VITKKTKIKKGDNFLYGYATKPMEKGTTWLTSQVENFNVKGLAVGTTLITANERQKIPIRILNTTRTNITLWPGTVIGQMEYINEDPVSPINLLLDNQEYIPEEADISKDLPLMPEEGISKEDFLMKNLDLSKSVLSPLWVQMV
jgi:hypothetical protein